MQASPTTTSVRAAMPAREWGRAAIACRVALIAGWLVALAVMLSLGARHTTFDALIEQVQAGHVHDVQVSSDVPVSRGEQTVDLAWRRGLLRYTTTVIETRDDQIYIGDDTEDLHFAAADALRTAGAAVQVRPGIQHSFSSSLMGWRLPTWAAWLASLLGLGTLASVCFAPQPRFATRWAWFWLMWGGGAVGLLAYLLLAGPVPFTRAPRNRRRLTAGWALLLAMAFSLTTTILRTVI